ncbi:chitin elicitor receptor kinase 1-like [Corylus avellana]|uniref:chitin elicitor receptor kinase 1-like n=1 Tax=Corylus avellana TaxID=13451 RepID=UPI00286B8733|nr:chitin elicitor receptor kinase 1-like [Corylus avellana]
MKKPRLGFLVSVLVSVFCSIAESKCSRRCDLALASYYVWDGSNLTFIAEVLQSDPDTIVSYNKQKIPNKDSVQQDIRINVPFPCNCIDGEYLGYVFGYTVRSGDTYTTVAEKYYANLTTVESLQSNNSNEANNIQVNARLNVPVTCSCGSGSVSREYGLFITYPLRPNDTVESVAAETNLSTALLEAYNPGVDFSQGSGVVYIPGKDTTCLLLEETVLSQQQSSTSPPASSNSRLFKPTPKLNQSTFNIINKHIQSNFSSSSPITTKDPVLDSSINSEPSFQFPNPMKPKLGFLLLVVVWVSVFCSIAESKCSKGCGLALASYYVREDSNLTYIAQVLQSDLNISPDTIVSYNKQTIPNKDYVPKEIRIHVPFPCNCINGEYLGYVFNYTVFTGDTYTTVAQTAYANLTTAESLETNNSYPANNIPNVNTRLNVPVTCSCGSSSVSKQYGLFITYPLRQNDTLESVAEETGLDSTLLQSYNPGVDFSEGSGGLVYIPGKDQNDTYPPLASSTSGLAGGVIAGIAIGGVAGVLLFAACIYLRCYRKKKVKAPLLLELSENPSVQNGHGLGSSFEKDVTGSAGGPAPGLTGISVDKSVEFSYEELATATDNFSMANKIGQGGFGAVYYAELRGEKAAIKKMDMQASKEFLAELNVLTRVHHLNLVRLIGYCVEGSLFLVYEFIENGNLSQHLRGSSGRDPLPWPTRVQIALDSARGLEYIHEHTVPVYIHRDIKSANILIDKNFHGKVADFGLTKLTEVGSTSTPTRLVGTFGYMPPEYAKYGDVSTKVDVYAFGVVLYELISAKEAVVRVNDSGTESKGLIVLFEDALNQPDPKEHLRTLVDPHLGEGYSFESVWKVAMLAKACTHENPQIRPSMRSIVVALMTLSSTTEDWDVGSFYNNQAMVNLTSGR